MRYVIQTHKQHETGRYTLHCPSLGLRLDLDEAARLIEDVREDLLDQLAARERVAA